jgi:hypothetical protein
MLQVTLRSGSKTVLSKRLYVAPNVEATPLAVSTMPAKWTSEKVDGRTLTFGGNSAVFDGRTGQLNGIRFKDLDLRLSGLLPNFWITPPGMGLGGFPDRREALDSGVVRYDPFASGDSAEAVCGMHIDHAGNPIRLDTITSVVKDGIHVRYRLTYGGQAIKVPAVGVRLVLPGSFTSWKWRGLGPWATYPGLAYAADPGVFEAPIVTKRRVGATIPIAEESLIGQWETQGGTKSEVDRFWLISPEGALEVVLGRRAFVECERVGDRVEVRINANVAELGDRQVLLEGIEGELLIRRSR